MDKYVVPVECPHDGKVLEIVSDESLKRNDSYSKFGQMETINLLHSDVKPGQQLSATLYPGEGNSSQGDTNAESSNVEKESSVKDANLETASLSKYFKSSPELQISSAPEAFFNALDEKKAEVANNLSGMPGISNTPSSQPGMPGISNTPSSQPVLQKFFAEDKSGSDADGKAFFDKIASASSCEDSGGINPQDKLERGFEFEQVFPHYIAPSESVEMPLLGSVPTQVQLYEAWIPTDATQNILRSIVVNPSSFVPDKHNLTEPNVIIEEELEDPVKALLAETNSPLVLQRKVLTANDVPQNEAGLKELIDADCYHAAINLTTRMLKSGYGMEQNFKTPKLMQLWFTRIALFVKLGKFSYAEVECEAFGDFDKPDLYYEFYPQIYPNRKGTLVPFSFRLLAAQLPQHQGNNQVALNKLYAILLTINRITANLQNGFSEDGTYMLHNEEKKKAALSLWNAREIKVFYAVLNCVLCQKDYVMSISIARILIDQDTEHTIQLYSALGRIYLQLGDLKAAKSYFDRVVSEFPKKERRLDQFVNAALYAVACNDIKEAHKMYKQALVLDPDNPMLVNNVAVCLLYLGHLKDSLGLLEKTIQANPKACLHEGLLFNLCTLYELESSHCTAKKQALLNVIGKYAGDNLNVHCLKIPPNIK